jgi:small-conductance mechanosensitive channel
MNRRKIAVWLVFLDMLLSTPAWSWDPTELPPGMVVETPGSPVELDGKPLFFIRVKLKTLSAGQRAAAVDEDIKKLAQDPLFDPQTITVRDSELSSDIMAGDKLILPVWEFEARVDGKPAAEVARDYAGRLRLAIAAYQEKHSLRNLVIGLVETFAVLIVLVALIMLEYRGVRRLNRAILASTRIGGIKVGGFEFFTADRIKAIILSLIKVMRLLIVLILLYIYFHLGLSFFPATQRYALNLYNSLWAAFRAIGEAIWDQTPALVFLAVLFFITRYVLRMLRYFFNQVGEGKVTIAGLDAEVAPITYRLLKILILVFVAVVAYPYIPGSSSPAFKGISIFVGVLFSLGSSSAIANLIAGVGLTYMRSFRVGDVIKVGDSLGVVLERRLYITRLRTYKNHIITIPNNTIFSSHVTNLSQQIRKGDGLILYTSVTIGYDAPWKTVHQLLIDAATRTTHVLKSPPPFVLQTALNDFYVTYELNAYTDAPEIMPWVYGELHENIQDAFNDAGVEIMSPHYTQVRDGNQTTIPAGYLPPDYEASAIRIVNTGVKGKKEST